MEIWIFMRNWILTLKKFINEEESSGTSVWACIGNDGSKGSSITALVGTASSTSNSLQKKIEIRQEKIHRYHDRSLYVIFTCKISREYRKQKLIASIGIKEKLETSQCITRTNYSFIKMNNPDNSSMSIINIILCSLPPWYVSKQT